MNIPTLSNIELFHQVRWLNGSLKDYYVNNIYWVVGDTLLIRLHHPSNPEKRLVIDRGRAIWVTIIKLEGENTDNLLNFFRKKLSRGKIIKVHQLGTERIIFIEFVGSEATKLVVEFFGKGNLILLDDANNILGALEYYETKHRRITIGTQYTPPPERGADPLKVDEAFFKPLLTYEDDFRKWIGKNLSLPKKYIDILPNLLNIPSSSTGKQINEQIVKALIITIRGFFSEDLTTIRPTLYLDNGEPVDFSLYPIGFSQYQAQEVENFNKALDELYTKNSLKEREQTLFHSIYKSREGLKKTIEDLQKKKETKIEDKNRLTEIANKIREYIPLYYQDKNQFEKTFGNVVTSLDNNIVISYKNFKYELDQMNPLKTSSEIFNTTKVLSQGILDIDSSIIQLEKDLQQIEKKITLKEGIVVQRSRKIFEKEWYERYRWFRTSEGFLAIGGRDASSNEAIIKKYLGEDDIVFHAEFTGSPFFIIKEGKKATESSINEVALAAVAFSNLWKLGTATGEAYWVLKDQVSKGAPSGQYISKGAFMIFGKKNYIKNIPIELAIGITRIKDHYTVICGPKEALKGSTEAYILILPGREEKNYIAKKIKAILAEKINNIEVKNIPLEDFIRTLPPGGCKIKLG